MSDLGSPRGNVPRRADGRYWVVAAVVVILGLSLLLSFNFASGQFAPDVWSNFISAVQVSTLVVVVALLILWVRSRGG